MSVLIPRYGAAAAVLLLLAACTGSGENLPAGSGPATTNTPSVSLRPAITNVPVVNPPGAVATPPVAATPVVPTAPAQSVVPGAGSSAAVMPATGPLAQHDVATLLAGNTATGITPEGQQYYALFEPDGQLRFQQGSYADNGTWRVLANGQLCTEMAKMNSGAQECYTLYRDGGRVRFDRPDGTPVGTFTVLAGNPQSL